MRWPPTVLADPQRRRRLGLALTAAPVAIQALFVALLGVNMLLWDEFYYVDFIRDVREGHAWWSWLLRQHNEHRVLPMKLVMAPLALLTGWDTRAEMYVSVVLAGLTVLGLWRLYRLVGGGDLLLFAPAAWLACSLAQYENMLYGMMMCQYFTIAGVVWSLVLLAGAPSALAVAGAAVCAFLASFSILNGFVVWPLGLAVLLLRRRPRAAVVWSVVAVASAALYFHDFQVPGGSAALPPLAAGTAVKVAVFFVKLIGMPLGAGSVPWAAVIGLLLLAAIAAAGWRWRGPRARLQRDAPLAALLLFGALSCAMIAAGRATFLGIPPWQSRYIIYSSLIFIALYLLLARDVESAAPASRPRLLLAGVLVLVVPGLLAANGYGVQMARRWRIEQLQTKMILQTFDQRPVSGLGAIYFPEQVPEKATYLRQNRLGPFKDAVDVMLLVRWQEGVPADEILPGRPVEQTLECAVGEIQDLGVVFATYARPNATSHVALSVWEGGRRLGGREVAAADLKDSGWLSVPVHVPNCRGRHLRLRIESPDARSGDAVTVWTYPPYYAGALSQPNNPRLAGRSLGLAINGFASQLLHE